MERAAPGRLTVSVGVIESHKRRAGSQQRFLHRTGGDMPGVQLIPPFLLFLLPAASIPGPRLGVAQTGSACGETAGEEPARRDPSARGHGNEGRHRPDALGAARGERGRPGQRTGRSRAGRGGKDTCLGNRAAPAAASPPPAPPSAAAAAAAPSPRRRLPRKNPAGRSGAERGQSGMAAAVPGGLFAVYKPAGVAWGRVREAVETRLLRGESGGTPSPRFSPFPGSRP